MYKQNLKAEGRFIAIHTRDAVCIIILYSTKDYSADKLKFLRSRFINKRLLPTKRQGHSSWNTSRSE